MNNNSTMTETNTIHNPLFNKSPPLTNIDDHYTFYAVSLLKNDDQITNTSIFTNKLNLDGLNQFVLYEVPKELYITIKNTTFYTIINVNDNDINMFNIFGLTFETEEIPILHLLNYHFLKIQRFIDSSFNYNYLQLIMDNNLIGRSFHDMYNSLHTTIINFNDTFWVVNKLQSYHITNAFRKRYFKTKILRNDVENKVCHNCNEFVIDNIIDKNNDYFVIEFNNTKIVNIDTETNNFIIPDNNNYTIENFRYLYDYIYHSEFRSKMIKKTLLSIDHCHLALNNPYLTLGSVKEIGYAMIVFYFAECRQKGNISDKYVFTLETASKLPVYKYNKKYPKYNPYLPLLINDEELDSENNLWGNPYVQGCGGINQYYQFVNRANIFISGNEKLNVFKDTFQLVDYAITGSIITACVQKRNALEFLHNNFKRFLDEYYCNSDIDVIINAHDILHFYKQSQILYNKINENLNTFHEQECLTTFTLEKKIILYVDDEYIENFLPDITPKYFCENLNDQNLIDRVVELYQDNINNYYDELFENCIQDNKEDDEIINHIINNNDNMTYILKYKYNYDKFVNIQFKTIIKSPFLERDIEMFKGFSNKFFDNIHSFHLACVRGYWNGNKVYLLPSCVISHLTFMNIDYYYYFGKYHPVEIINKYRQRGFGTFLNKQEINDYFRILKNNPYWNNLMYINEPNESKSQDEYDDYISSNQHLTGHIDIDNVFFKPRLHNSEYFMDDNISYVENDYKDISNPPNGNINVDDFKKYSIIYKTGKIKKIDI